MSDAHAPDKPPRANDNFRETARLDRTTNDFQSDAAAIEEAPVPLSAHAALWIVLILLTTAVLWSVIGTVDRIVVVAPGKVATRTPMLVMQPFSTSRIIEVAVKTGDHVVKGQVLVRFDPAFANADVSSLQQKIASLTAQTQRLEAQLSGAPFSAGPEDGPERNTQGQIYQQEMNDFRAEVSQRDSRLAQVQSQISTDESALPGIQQQLNMAQRVVEMQERLRQQKAAATLDVMRAQSALIDSQLKLRNTSGERDKLVQQRGETEHERQAYLQKWRSDHNQELVKARQELSEATENMKKASRMHELTELVAPVSGVVQQVADRSVGSVLREAETLVTIVPDGADLYIEANVPSRDVSYLKLGDTVRVKLEAYPFQRFGTVSGVLTVLSPDSQPIKEGDDGSRLVYRAQVKLNDNASKLAARKIYLKPGLVASAEIKTGTRSIASYMLDPVLRISDESLREP
ncbi:MAG: HlyD family type I secretion periplasmic adaptor subunit [Alphaproteobacteria bacterium]|nr:HlyD family type I secretion periplasmic adaptor subunit [Alphaproteobacteria bacterium]